MHSEQHVDAVVGPVDALRILGGVESRIFLPSMMMQLSPSVSTEVAKRPWVVSYFSRWALVQVAGGVDGDHFEFVLQTCRKWRAACSDRYDRNH